MKKLLPLLCAVFALADAGRAAALTFDLGQGLAFHRVHRLPDDLPTAEAERKQPCVLDLRFVAAEAEAAKALAAWLQFHATAQAPVFILANAATSPALLTAATARSAPGSIVVFGASAVGFRPDVAVASPPEVEQRAYDALEQGTAIQTLLTDHPDKTRNDEASLARERRPANPPGDEPTETPSAAPATSAAPSAPKTPAPPPLIDATLQRAVQLHRTLIALKKL